MALPGIVDARDDKSVVQARLRAPGLLAELCRFPALRQEEVHICEMETTLSLGLSPLLPEAAGRYRPGPYSRFSSFGALNLRPAGVPLEYRHAGGEFSSVRLRLDNDYTARISTDDEWSQEELKACLNIEAPRIEDAMLRVAEECERPDEHSIALLTGLATVICADLARYFLLVRHHERNRKGGLSALHLRKIANHVQHENGPVTVAELAKLCDLSSSHLMRAFRQSTGKTIAKYVGEVRVAKAKTLLAETNMPVSQIARQLNFSTPAAFSTIFKRVTGRPPSEYRSHVG